MPEPSLFSRLKDRKLVQWGVAYLAAAWVLVEATGHVIDQFGWPVGISQVVTILAFFGFFVVLVVAWYHGEKGRQWVSGPELLIIALLLLISGGVLSMLRRPPGPEGPSPAGSASAPESSSNPSIAVLPFENLSPNPEDAFFAGGLQDELLTQLSKVEALKVISRTSVREYATVNKPLREIAEELGVTSLVEGSVQVLGDRLRVNVQLIDAFTDEHLWADRFDRDLDDAFAVQTEIARRVVAEVGAVLRGSELEALEEIPTANPEAYRLYLQGLEYYGRLGRLRENYGHAELLYRRALDLDSTFALAYAALSEIHGRMAWHGYDPSPERLLLQREAAETAVRLAPDLPQAHFAMGMWQYFGQRDWNAALETFERATEGLPNSAYLWARLAYVNRRMGHWAEVQTATERATELDPRGAELWEDLGGGTNLLTRRYPEAVAAYNRALTLAPDFRLAAVRKGRTFVLWKGELDTLRAALDQSAADADLGPVGTARMQRAELLLWERKPDSILDLVRSASNAVFDSQNFYWPTDLFAAWAYRLNNDPGAERASALSALAVCDSVVAQFPEDWRVHVARGMALAVLGEAQSAGQEADWLRQFVTSINDAFLGPRIRGYRAMILAGAGASEAALAEIEELLDGPSWVSPHTLRLDPRWDRLRDNPRFRGFQERDPSG